MVIYMKKHIIEYEEILLEFSAKMKWLLKQNRSIPYRMAVWKDMHDRTIQKLEIAHQNLLDHRTVGG